MKMSGPLICAFVLAGLPTSFADNAVQPQQPSLESLQYQLNDLDNRLVERFKAMDDRDGSLEQRVEGLEKRSNITAKLLSTAYMVRLPPGYPVERFCTEHGFSFVKDVTARPGAPNDFLLTCYNVAAPTYKP